MLQFNQKVHLLCDVLRWSRRPRWNPNSLHLLKLWPLYYFHGVKLSCVNVFDFFHFTKGAFADGYNYKVLVYLLFAVLWSSRTQHWSYRGTGFVFVLFKLGHRRAKNLIAWHFTVMFVIYRIVRIRLVGAKLPDCSWKSWIFRLNITLRRYRFNLFLATADLWKLLNWFRGWSVTTLGLMLELFHKFLETHLRIQPTVNLLNYFSGFFLLLDNCLGPIKLFVLLFIYHLCFEVGW